MAGDQKQLPLPFQVPLEPRILWSLHETIETGPSVQGKQINHKFDKNPQGLTDLGVRNSHLVA